MKIGLLTIHWANNYGASLQTFATVKALQAFGEVRVLDYRTAHAAKGMQLIRFGTHIRDVLRVGKDICRIFSRHRVINKFKAFTFDMPLTRQLISESDFDAIAQDFDAFVCGSDQIWNPQILGDKNEIDPHFMLDFATKKSKVSFASSIGSYVYSSGQESQVRQLLHEFSALSVRERDAAEYLEGILDRPVATVVDPTLLHTSTQWLSFFNMDTQALPERPFILVYALEKNKTLKLAVEYIRGKLGFDVISIDQDPFINYVPDKHIKDAGPEEFIRLFSLSSFVVTNSFHGTCFSVNFNKNFVVTPTVSSPNRIINLLTQLHLENRFIMDASALNDLEMDIDFTIANDNLNIIRKSSKDFLEDALGVI